MQAACQITCLTVGFHVDAPDQTVAFHQRKNVIAIASFLGRGENLDPVVEAKQPLCALAIAQGRIKWAEDAQPPGWWRQGGGLFNSAGAGKDAATAAIRERDINRFDLPIRQRLFAPRGTFCGEAVAQKAASSPEVAKPSRSSAALHSQSSVSCGAGEP